MDEREALERLAAASHAAYVLERAQAALAGCDVKLDKAQVQVDAAKAAGKQARADVAYAKADHAKACKAADEVPDNLRAAVAALRPDVVAVDAQTAQGTGGAS